jgi:excisionase family DNA binding protein
MGRKPSPAGEELAQLAELVAERVLDALALPPGTRDRPRRDALRGDGIDMPSGTLLTAEEVAEMLGVTTAWIYGQSRTGRIPTVKLGRYYRYRLEAIEAWINEQEDAA